MTQGSSTPGFSFQLLPRRVRPGRDAWIALFRRHGSSSFAALSALTMTMVGNVALLRFQRSEFMPPASGMACPVHRETSVPAPLCHHCSPPTVILSAGLPLTTIEGLPRNPETKGGPMPRQGPGRSRACIAAETAATRVTRYRKQAHVSTLETIAILISHLPWVSQTRG